MYEPVYEIQFDHKLEGYRYAIEELKKRGGFICNKIHFYLNTIGYLPASYPERETRIFKLFPELMEVKPDFIPNNTPGMVWYLDNEEGKAARIKALERCIELVYESIM